jgi:cardiolipin synthase
MTLHDIFGFIFYLIGALAAAHAILKAREPRSAVLWLLLCLFLPLLGATLYVLFGINRIKRVTRHWQLHGLTQGDEQGLISGCKITALIDPEAAYNAMLDAIDSAEKYIFLASYVFAARGAGREFIAALERAVARQVEVKVLIDGVGTLYTLSSTYRKLKRKKIPVRLFLSPLHSFRGFLFLNLRNHTKIMVVDGNIGFTGGMNIVSHQLHDLHFKCEGPVVNLLQDTFWNLWDFTEQKSAPPHGLTSHTEAKGSASVRGIENGPYQDISPIAYSLTAALYRAQKRVQIMTPYFIIDSVLISALINTASRGVNIEVILPEKNNLSFVKGATETLLPLLLKYGIIFYYRQGIFAHSKMVIIDHEYVLLGSSNLDTRSFRLNFEFNLEVYDTLLNAHLSEHFAIIKKHSRPISAVWLQKQSFVVKLRNALCKLLSLYL